MCTLFRASVCIVAKPLVPFACRRRKFTTHLSNLITESTRPRKCYRFESFPFPPCAGALDQNPPHHLLFENTATLYREPLGHCLGAPLHAVLTLLYSEGSLFSRARAHALLRIEYTPSHLFMGICTAGGPADVPPLPVCETYEHNLRQNLFTCFCVTVVQCVLKLYLSQIQWRSSKRLQHPSHRQSQPHSAERPSSKSCTVHACDQR